ncbi:hypothetical protein [Pedobacter sp. JY14-1]|uniref:hypothetical protein n=1 Tax=Pedobacter sp. JY14-1 TaxID=3034151 RepID=UPI0023E26031|nr:hypothetical protein [Pedobacter sp. JY14-1]
MKLKLLKLLFSFHLLIVFLGSNLFEYKSKFLDNIILPYAAWTGGGFGYSFFSPNVGNQTVVKAYTLHSDKTLRQDALGAGTDMLDNRFGSVIQTFRNQKAYELMARTVAAYVFAKYPDAGVTHISVGEYQSPGISEYRKNKPKARFREIYNGTYTN